MNTQRFARRACSAAVLGALASFALGAHATATGSCHLANGIQHIVYIQFDNTHIERDNPNVPSDLEQMPNLLNFLKGKGTFLVNHHTPLISHTADDIITSLTGVYGDKHGQPVANSFGYFNADGSVSFSSSFAYWTDPKGSTSVPIMVSPNGAAAPAPWVPYARIGCDVGQVSVANTVLENITSDINTVFGVGSPEYIEASNSATKAQAAADFEGIAIHCGYNSPLCNTSNARTDKLRSEPGGYLGYKALFGHKYVAATISPNQPLLDLNGNVIQDANGHVGFPGFGPIPAATSLGYVATMLEAGVPVIYSYIADAHDGPSGAYGPGEAGYVNNLKQYNDAFGKFFARLAADGIDETNTLFVITTEEQDHYAGTRNPTPAGCDGVTTPCTYSHTTSPVNSATVGEVNVNLSRLLKTEKGNTTPFSVHSDMAPAYYISGHPGSTDAVTRQLERDVSGLTAYNPYRGLTENLVDYLIDPVGMKMLHMVTADPSRTPSFIAFQKGDYYSFASGTSACTAANYTDCVNIQPSFAYNHGGYQPEITTLWLGLVGPGVNANGTDSTTWTDETDIRPTMLRLAGLTDDYAHDGRVIVEALQDSALPSSLAGANRTAFVQLAQAYKQVNAPLGALGMKTLQASTVALTANDANDTNDAIYASCSAQIAQWTTTRDNLAAQMRTMLENAAFSGASVDATAAASLVSQANDLISAAHCN
jgi:hypothetical protein